MLVSMCGEWDSLALNLDKYRIINPIVRNISAPYLYFLCSVSVMSSQIMCFGSARCLWKRSSKGAYTCTRPPLHHWSTEQLYFPFFRFWAHQTSCWGLLSRKASYIFIIFWHKITAENTVCFLQACNYMEGDLLWYICVIYSLTSLPMQVIY